MARVTKWDLPLSSYNPYPLSVANLVTDGKASIHYCKYTNDVVGILNTKKFVANSQPKGHLVQEWQIPANLHFAQGGSGSPPTGSPQATCIDGKGDWWYALLNGGALIRQVGNDMTSFRSSQTPGWATNPTWYPFSNVRALFSRRDEIWFCGNGPVKPRKGWTSDIQPYIGVFNAKKQIARLWQLPYLKNYPWMGLLGPSAIWVDPPREEVYCSIYHTQAHIFGNHPHPFLWRLNPNSNVSRIWYRHHPQFHQPDYVGARHLVPDDPANPGGVFVIREDPSSQQLVYYNKVTQSFTHHIPGNAVHMQRLATMKGIWVGSATPDLRVRSQGVGCDVQVQYDHMDINLRPVEYEVEATTVTVPPVEYSAPPVTTQLQLNKTSCFDVYPCGAPGTGVVYPMDSANGSIAFGQISGNTLGVLET